MTYLGQAADGSAHRAAALPRQRGRARSGRDGDGRRRQRSAPARPPTHGEGFYVLAGDLSFQVGDDIITGGPGTWVFAPRDTPHTLANHGEQDGLLLCVFAPAGFERRFERMPAKTTGDAVPDALSEAEQATRLVGTPMRQPTRPGRRGG